MTKEQKLKKKYTYITKIGDKYATFLQIDYQGFCVVEDTTKKRANWYAKQLSVALNRIIERENDNRT